MLIRMAKMEELDCILEIYGQARAYMARNGNGSQWGSTHPARELIVSDIQRGQCYAGICEDGLIHCVLALIGGEDPTYLQIDGEWLNHGEYMTIHRIASDGQYHGTFGECMNYCKKRSKNLRIDTHRDNATMHHLLKKNGFIRCGTIYLENGDPRIAYQWTAA